MAAAFCCAPLHAEHFRIQAQLSYDSIDPDGGGYSSDNDRWSAHAEFGLPRGFALPGRVYAADDGNGFGFTLTWRDL